MSARFNQLTTSSKLMAVAAGGSVFFVALSGSLGCFHCEKPKKDEQSHYMIWVTCIDNKPVLMRYFGDFAVTFPNSSDPSFNPADWDCSHQDSPKYRRGMAPMPAFGLGGPLFLSQRQRLGNPRVVSSYYPSSLLSLPFIPPGIPEAPQTACDSSFPDILQVNHNRATVSRVSTCPFKSKVNIPVASRPLQVELTPDGTMALVTSFDNAVNFIDLASNRVTFTLTTDPSINPHGLAISPDGARAYISSFNQDNPVVATIDMSTRRIVGTLRVSAYPQGLILTPDGSQLWVTHPFGGAVFVIDTLSNTMATFIAANQPYDVAFNSTATRAYITASGNPGSVLVVDTATYQVVKTYTVGAGPGEIYMSPGDQFLVVNNTDGNSVSVIDLVQDKVSTALVGSAPQGIARVR